MGAAAEVVQGQALTQKGPTYRHSGFQHAHGKVPAVGYIGSPLTEVGRGGGTRAPAREKPWPGPNSNRKWLLSTGYYFEVWNNKQEVFSLQMILVKPQG